MLSIHQTTRLELSPLQLSDAAFIFELLNTEGWKKFIGDRNINNLEEAQAYIQKILANSTVSYWKVNLRENSNTLGIITLIKRDYLEHSDIGFAFLPQHARNGYAYEAALTILNELKKDSNHSQILATTLKDNAKSIGLLKKLGLSYFKTILVEKEELLVYAMKFEL